MNYVKVRAQITKELKRIDERRKIFKTSVMFDIPTGKALAYYRSMAKDEKAKYLDLREAAMTLREMFK